MARYRMTPKRRAALRKAQAASARKRRRTHNRRLAIAGGVTVVAVTAAGAAGYHSYRKGRNISEFQRKSAAIRSNPGRVKLSRSKVIDVVRVTGLSADAGRSLFPPAMKRTIVKITEADRIARIDKRAARRFRESVAKKKTVIRNQRKRIKYWKKKTIPKRNRYTRRWGIT